MEGDEKFANRYRIEVFVARSYVYDESFVPIFDGKIEGVVKDIKDLRMDVEKLKQEVGEIKRKRK